MELYRFLLFQQQRNQDTTTRTERTHIFLSKCLSHVLKIYIKHYNRLYMFEPK